MNVFLSMVATVAFAVLYQIPRKAILPVGLLGIVAELFLIAASEEHVGLVAVSFAASLTISLLGEGFARTLRMPVTIFSVPGIIVLVPGMNAYQTMKDFVTHQFMQGIAMGTETALIAGAIASGLVMAGVLARSVWRPRKNVD